MCSASFADFSNTCKNLHKLNVHGSVHLLVESEEEA